MRLPNNTPKQFSWFENKGLENPQLEDGNTPSGTNQGKIYTSEITTNDYYNTNYSSPIVTVVSSRKTKGNDYSSFITVEYVADLAGVHATNPGFFGSNLISENDSFSIKSVDMDWVRGIVTKVLNVSYIQLSPGSFSYNYELQCSIIQGDPMLIKTGKGTSFLWKRSLVMDKANFNEANPPINLKGSLNYNTRELFFYWDKVNKESREYRLSLRFSQSSNNFSYTIIKVHGNTANPTTSLTPFINFGTSQLSCIRINDQGIDMNSNRTIDIKGTSSSAIFATFLDNNGSLLKNEFYLYDCVVGTNKIYLVSEKMRPEYLTQYPVPNSHSYAEGLPTLNDTSDFYIHNVISLTYNQYEVEIFEAKTGLPISITVPWKDAAIGTYIKSHDGVYSINLGIGYEGDIKAEVKKIPDNVQAYIDPQIPGSVIPGPGTTWAWAVSAIYDDINKQYTEWSPEDYIHF